MSYRRGAELFWLIGRPQRPNLAFGTAARAVADRMAAEHGTTFFCPGNDLSFAIAVEHIRQSCADDAVEVVLASPQTVEEILHIASQSPGRQRLAVYRIAHGESPFDPPQPGDRILELSARLITAADLLAAAPPESDMTTAQRFRVLDYLVAAYYYGIDLWDELLTGLPPLYRQANRNAPDVCPLTPHPGFAGLQSAEELLADTVRRMPWRSDTDERDDCGWDIAGLLLRELVDVCVAKCDELT